MNTSSTFQAADGDGYELLMGRWSRRLAQPFLDFVGLVDGEQVLDVGCGTGSLAAAVAARTKTSTVDAIDFSPAYVEHARRRHRDPRLQFEVGDACDLHFADGSFDRVLSLLVLHFVPRAPVAIAQMRRVARPGAVVAAAVWDAHGGLVFNRMFFDTAAALDPAASERRARNFTRPMTRPGELARAPMPRSRGRSRARRRVEGALPACRLTPPSASVHINAGHQGAVRTRMYEPVLSVNSACSSSGTSGSKAPRSFDTASSTTTAIGSVAKFC